MLMRKKIIIGGIIFALTSSGVAFWYFRDSRNNLNDTNLEQQDKDFQELLDKNKQAQEKEKIRIDSLASSTETVDDLKKLDDQDQAKVGIQIASSAVTSKSVSSATIEIIQFLMQRNDSDGIEASKLCYRVLTSESDKSNCVDRLTEQMRSQGIIGPNETIPIEYLQTEGGDLGA